MVNNKKNITNLKLNVLNIRFNFVLTIRSILKTNFEKKIL